MTGNALCRPHYSLKLEFSNRLWYNGLVIAHNTVLEGLHA